AGIPCLLFPAPLELAAEAAPTRAGVARVAASAAGAGQKNPLFGSAAAAQQSTADLHQVTDAQLAVAVLVQHGAEQAAAQAALLADFLLFPTQDAAERVRIGVALALPGHAIGQVRHHDRRETLPQLAGLAALQPGGLGDAGLGARLPAAEDVAEDAGAVGLPVLRAAEHRAQHAAQVAAGVVVLECAEQRLRPLGLAGIAAQRAHQQR